MYVQLLARARRHGYGLRQVRVEALGQTWNGWEVEGMTPPAAPPRGSNARR